MRADLRLLAGTAIALSFERRRLVGALDRDLDRHLFKRALVILAFELLWWSPFNLQVLFAIAMGLICMIPLRRLSTRTLLITALSILFLYEALFWGIMHLGGITPDLIREVTNMPVPDGEFDQEAMNEVGAQVRNLGWMTVFTPFFHPGTAGQDRPHTLVGTVSLCALAGDDDTGLAVGSLPGAASSRRNAHRRCPVVDVGRTPAGHLGIAGVGTVCAVSRLERLWEHAAAARGTFHWCNGCTSTNTRQA